MTPQEQGQQEAAARHMGERIPSRVWETRWPHARPAVAFEEDDAFSPAKGGVVGIEYCGTPLSHCERFIFMPSEDVIRRGSGLRAHYKNCPPLYLPARKVRFTDEAGTPPAV